MHHRAVISTTAERETRGELTMPNTVRLHRVVATKPEKVYRAFIEPDAMAKWLPPNGFTCTVHHMDPKAGGSYRLSFRNFTTGHGHSFGGQYVELVPNERLRYTDKFEDPNLPGEIQVTVTLKKVSLGTEVNIVQEGKAYRMSFQSKPVTWAGRSRCETWPNSSSLRSLNNELGCRLGDYTRKATHKKEQRPCDS